MAGMVEFWVACYGITLIVTGSRLFAPLRRFLDARCPLLGALSHCPMCVGFWVGAIASVLTARPNPFMNGAASSAFCWAAHVTLARLGAEDL